MPGQSHFARADWSGTWRFEDSGGLASATLALRQEGARISGAAYYETGSALVEGRADPERTCLYITYDAAKVLAKWIPEKYAPELLGLRSRLTITYGNGTEPFVCMYQGFYVRFSQQSGVIQTFDADSPGVEDVHPPRLGLLQRIHR